MLLCHMQRKSYGVSPGRCSFKHVAVLLTVRVERFTYIIDHEKKECDSLLPSSFPDPAFQAGFVYAPLTSPLPELSLHSFPVPLVVRLAPV